VKTGYYPIHHQKYAQGASIEGHKREAKKRTAAEKHKRTINAATTMRRIGPS